MRNTNTWLMYLLIFISLISISCTKDKTSDTPSDCCNCSNDLKEGLIAYFPFSGNLIDSSKYGNNATNFGASPCPDRFGKANSAFTFNNTYMTVPNIPAYAVNDYSISLWIKTASEAVQVPVVKLTYEDASNEQFGFVLNQPEKIDVEFAAKYNNGLCLAGQGWLRNRVKQPLLDNKFHHLVGIVDGIDTYIYIDGKLFNISRATVPKSSSCFNGNIQIGRNWSNFKNYFQGVIDDIRIYNRALSECEIQYLYKH